MTNDAPRLSLVEDLDARQNQLLAELDKLNCRIEQLLKTCQPSCIAEPTAAAAR